MLAFRAYTAADRDWVQAANAVHYRNGEGFDASFVDAVSSALDVLQGHFAHADWCIAERDGAPVGCIFLTSADGQIGRIRLFYLAAAMRGQGKGARLLDHVLGRAEQAGLSRIDVSTFDAHAAVCGLYRRRGFTEQTHPPQSHFGRRMRQVDFSLAL